MFLYKFLFDGFWFFIIFCFFKFDWFFFCEWKLLKNIYEIKIILVNLFKKCRYFCDWFCIFDDVFNVFVVKMFIYCIYFVSLYMYL